MTSARSIIKSNKIPSSVLCTVLFITLGCHYNQTVRPLLSAGADKWNQWFCFWTETRSFPHLALVLTQLPLSKWQVLINPVLRSAEGQTHPTADHLAHPGAHDGVDTTTDRRPGQLDATHHSAQHRVFGPRHWLVHHTYGVWHHLGE